MGVLTFDGPDDTLLNLLETNQGVVRVRNSASIPGVTVNPWVANYYVDQTFAGTSTGSQSNPFKTIAAAFAAGVAALATTAIIWLAPQLYAENIVFPTTGNWELASPDSFGAQQTLLSGTVDVSVVGGTVYRRAFTNVTVAGAISGSSGVTTQSRLRFVNSAIGNLTLTSAGIGWRVEMMGSPVWSGNPQVGTSGTVNIVGSLSCLNWQINGSTTLTNAGRFENCSGGGPGAPLVNGGTGGQVWQFIATSFAGLTPVNSVNPLTLYLDGFSAAQVSYGSLQPQATVTVITLNANATDRRVIGNNLAAQTLIASYASPVLIQCTATLTVLSSGTLGPTVNLQVLYTDLNGTLQTKTVAGPLNITAAAGTEVSGSINFSANFAAGGVVQWQVTGVTTPGVLSLNAAISAEILR